MHKQRETKYGTVFYSHALQNVHKAVNYAAKFQWRVIMREVINLPSNKQRKPQKITQKLLHITFLSLCLDAHINVQKQLYKHLMIISYNGHSP